MNPEIKAACERILLQRKAGCSFSHTPDAPAIARAYLDQCAEIERLREFFEYAFMECVVEGCGLEGGCAQDKMEALGLIELRPVNPAENEGEKELYFMKDSK